VLSSGRRLRLVRLDMALVFLESVVNDLSVCPLYTLPHSQGMLYVLSELRLGLWRDGAGGGRDRQIGE
jgi:hypothetical protein